MNSLSKTVGRELQVLMPSAILQAHTPDLGKKPVSPGLANLRVEDLRLLSV